MTVFFILIYVFLLWNSLAEFEHRFSSISSRLISNDKFNFTGSTAYVPHFLSSHVALNPRDSHEEQTVTEDKSSHR